MLNLGLLKLLLDFILELFEFLFNGGIHSWWTIKVHARVSDEITIASSSDSVTFSSFRLHDFFAPIAWMFADQLSEIKGLRNLKLL